MRLFIKALISGLLVVIFVHLSYWVAVSMHLDRTLAGIMYVTEIIMFVLVFLVNILMGLQNDIH